MFLNSDRRNSFRLFDVSIIHTKGPKNNLFCMAFVFLITDYIIKVIDVELNEINVKDYLVD